MEEGDEIEFEADGLKHICLIKRIMYNHQKKLEVTLIIMDSQDIEGD